MLAGIINLLPEFEKGKLPTTTHPPSSGDKLWVGVFPSQKEARLPLGANSYLEE